MIIHVLPGDSLVDEFKKTGIEGEVVVFREFLICGDLEATSLEEFWDVRANFIEIEYGGDPIEYREHVAYELERLTQLAPDDEAYLWFEYDLFCQVNMWFCLDLLKTHTNVFRVAPLNASPDDVWKGFGGHTVEDLNACFEGRTRFSQTDIETGGKLWKAFREGDTEKLRSFGSYRSETFPFLHEVTDAAAELATRPSEIVRQIMAESNRDLDSVFSEFQKRAGVYGLGDLQVQRLIERL